jgi:activator of HSP90 ATPase
MVIGKIQIDSLLSSSIAHPYFQELLSCRMPKTITQTITFKNQKVSALYSMFLDGKLHARITGGVAARISAKEGSKFSTHGGYINGRNLQLIRNKLIVQSWKASDWSREDIDSTLVLVFVQKGNNAVILMTHANVPDKHAWNIKSGWTHFYWQPWKNYLKTLK